ncbi:MAG: rod shape-determining protein [Bryobacterales bacterium]|nr:rod shape-determining protein [Bryobacterales bacterium]
MMNLELARLLVRSFLERLEDDLNLESPRFRGVCSKSEREALRYLVEFASAPAEAIRSLDPIPDSAFLDEQISTAPESELEVDEVSPTPIIEMPAPAGEVHEPVDSAGTGERQSLQAPVGSIYAASDLSFEVDGTAWTQSSPPGGEFVLCLDFGTAKSKAFAASVNGDSFEDVDLVEIALGRRDNDIDRAVYTVASSVWISDDGLMHAGSSAMLKSMEAGVVGNASRRRLDSVKQQLTLISVEQDLRILKLEPEINPTTIDLSYEDAICFYLGYITDLAVSELEVRGHSRYLRRRFTIPAWRETQRAWAAPILARLLIRAQVLADTFHGHWAKGIPATSLKKAIAAAELHEKELLYLLDGYNARSETFPKGLLEPIAAGSGRIMADRNARNLVLIVDVGAGTTDFSLFWSVQGPKGRKAYPVEPCGDAVKVAGDILDEILIAELLNRADGSLADWMRKRFETEIRHLGIRRMKETLFVTGRLDLTVADQSVSIELEEFLSLERVKRFGQTIEDAIRKFLASVDPTWRKADQALIVLTGGGASLPMVKDLVNKRWELGGRPITFKPAETVPEAIQEFDADFQREYPQLAVAIGGALPVLEERFMLREFAGAATKPGPLERTQMTGV